MYHGVSGPMYQRGGQRTGGASLSLNFLAGRLDPRITFTRGSTATYRDSTGTRQTAAINAARFDYSATGVPLGLLIEESRQNVFLASGAPATQTVTLTAGNWTVWMEGTGSITSSAGTATATGYGAASAGTPNVINVTVGGTVILTVSGARRLRNARTARLRRVTSRPQELRSPALPTLR